MTITTLVCIGMASVAFYAGGYHLLIYLKQRRAIKHFRFAVLCFSAGVYDVFSAGLYSSKSIEDGIVWERLQFESAFVMTVCLTWFLGVYARNIGRNLLRWVISGAAILILLSRILPAKFTLSLDRPSIKTVGVNGWFEVTYFESEPGILYTFALALIVALYVYLLIGLVSRYLQTRDKETLVITSSQIPFFLAVVNDSLIASGIYEFVYVSEYAFMFVILAMSYVLLNGFVHLYDGLAKSHLNLELKVAERTKEIRSLNEELQRLADVDGLTNAYNRRFLESYLAIELRRAHSDAILATNNDPLDPGMNFGLAMLDIDDFGKLNDKYGPVSGDLVLVALAGTIRRSIFERDLLCRYGGDKFVVVFTRTSRQGIIDAAEKICGSVRQEKFVIDDIPAPMNITVSIGVSSLAEVHDEDPRSIVRAASECLLAAKKLGKDRVIARKVFAESTSSLSTHAVAAGVR